MQTLEGILKNETAGRRAKQLRTQEAKGRKRERDHLVQQSPDRKWKREFGHFRVERYDRGSDFTINNTFFY